MMFIPPPDAIPFKASFMESMSEHISCTIIYMEAKQAEASGYLFIPEDDSGFVYWLPYPKAR
jgi:hypothetical protein